jgi:hypothetical protein
VNATVILGFGIGIVVNYGVWELSVLQALLLYAVVFKIVYDLGFVLCFFFVCYDLLVLYL